MAPLDAAALDRLFRAARTPQSFLDQPFTEPDARALYDLVRWGPTSNNMSPMRIVWLLTGDGRERLARHASQKNADKIRAAPAALVVGMDRDFHLKMGLLAPHVDAATAYADEGRRAENAFRNASLQGGYLILAARALGFDMGVMSGFDAAGVDAEFFAGTTIRANFVSTIGRGDPATVRPRAARLSFNDANTIL